MLQNVSDSLLKDATSRNRDNIDFLNKWNRNTDENAVIATFDVVALHSFGLVAVRYFLSKYEDV